MFKILILGLFLARSAFATGGPEFDQYSPNCKIAVLQKLGWNISQNSSLKQSAMQIARPCDAGSIEQIRTQNQLSLKLSANPSDHELDQALTSTGSVCAYKQLYNKALHDAEMSLHKNHLYSFNSFIGSGVARLSLLKNWQRTNCSAKDKCYTPTEIHPALRSFTEDVFSTDCESGVLVAEYLALDNLFGSRDVQNYFSREEFFIGTWPEVEGSKSITHGNLGRIVDDETAKTFSRLGVQAIIGLSGYLGETSLTPTKTLDRKVDQNENFLVADATKTGIDAFVKEGGQDHYFNLLKSIWLKSKSVSKTELQAIQNLAEQHHLTTDPNVIIKAMYLNTNTNELPQPMPSVSAAAIDLVKMLQDPFLETTILYVHPSGMKSISWHLARLSRINPRTSYDLFFYPEKTTGEIFDRWMSQQLDECTTK